MLDAQVKIKLLPTIIPLWEHQKKMVELSLAAGRDGFAYFAEMGTGKTAATINTLRNVYFNEKKILRTLIICPIVVCENWRREFNAHSKMGAKVHVLKGAGKRRLKIFNEQIALDPSQVFVTNFEALQMKDLYACLKKWGPQVVVVDESQRIKNYKSLRTKLVVELGDSAQYRYILSGTPILNNPMDIFGQYRFLDKGTTFDRNFFAFRNRFFFDKNAGMPSQKYFPDWRPRPGIEKEFHRMIYKKAIRVLKKDCLDLPPIVRKQVTVELAADQKKMYDSMRKHFIAYLDDKACVASIALTKALRMQQIVSGFFMDDEGAAHQFKESPRLDALKECIELLPENAKVIIWSCFKENYKVIEDMLEQLGIKYAILIGGLTDTLRQQQIDLFQTDPTVRVMVANQQAGGVGVTLTAASYMIYYSRSFSLEADLQSEARCHRGGSEIHDKITRIDLVAPATIDEIILEALVRKENLAESILRIKERL